MFMDYEQLPVMFSTSKCPGLRSCPKVFVINACQGSMAQRPARLDMIELKYACQIKVFSRGAHHQNNGNIQHSRSGNSIATDGPPAATAASFVFEADEVDYLIALATTPNRSAYRDKTEGSFFIQVNE